ncbi:amino acid adenylation domain-containing protein [Scytonema sp. PRP1]|uniref:amino acid adenylation domain-containing protein n=1 Tax=Scytonema sp. PRP1 TaxID=3120513 RepID=UPI00300D40DA
MNLAQFLHNLSTKNVQLWVEGNELCYRSPRDVLTPALLSEIKQHKLEIINILIRRAATPNTIPLSHGQQALWFLYKLAPESAAYNVAFTARICSNLDVLALRQAFGTLIARHPMLRTTFREQNGEPVQEVHQFQEVWLEEVDASTWNGEELKQRVVEAYKRPINLETGPVMRVNLFGVTEQDYVLLLTIHHIACDGWSLWILVNELRLLYAAQKERVKATLPAINFFYQDFIQWQAQILSGSQREDLWKYWQQQLAGELPLLNLPTDRPRPSVQTYQGASHAFKLSKEVVQKLKELAQVEGVTLYMILLAAFGVLLHRYTGQSDILVGSSTTGRSKTEFANIVGYFVNPVVLRANFLGNPTFKAFLAQVRSRVLGAIAHQDYPFPLLVKQLQSNRDISYSPIFQVSFVLQKPQQDQVVDLLNNSETGIPVNWGSLLLKPFEMAQQEGQFDLTLEMVETKESLKSAFKYNTDLFDVATIERMAGHFQTLLEAVVSHPSQRVSDLPLLDDAQRHQLLVEWNQTQVSYPQDKCIHELFEQQVEWTPDAVAVVFEEQQLTYRELNSRANQLAHYLQSLGVGVEVLVGICVERSLDMVVGLLGILKAGGAYVPLDPAYPKERLAFMLSDAKVPVLLTQQRFSENLPKQQAQIIYLDNDWEIIAQQSKENLISKVVADNLAYVIYTSGTTGKPKGVMISHRAICNHMFWMQETFPLTEADKVLQKTPFSFDASVWEFYAPLLVGAQLVMARPGGHQDSAYLIKEIADRKVTAVQLVPSLLQILLEQGGIETCDSLRRIFCGGEVLPVALQERLFANLNVELHNLYGPTEACIDTTYWTCNSGIHQQTIPIGRPIANTQIYILDSNLQPVPIGVPGELHIGGAGLARGYLNRRELTQEKFIPNPFSTDPNSRLYKTGDLARYLPNGNIEYLGRIDNQVKIRGFRIELGEIEAILSQHPSVHSVVVTTRVDTPGDQRLVAYIVPQQHTAPTMSKLRQFLKTKLPEYMVPSAIVMLESLPLTPNGKVDRRALPSPDTNNLAMQASFVPPLDIVEQKLAQIWAEVLKVYPVGIKDNFFDIGGHSLLAVQLMARIEQQFKKNLPLAALFQNSTIEQLATILRQPIDALNWSPIVPIQPNGSKRPFFCVPGTGGNTIYLYNLAHHLGKEQPFYGLQSLGVDGESKPHTRIEDMAAYYIEAIHSIQPSGPYLLGGHSFGGMVAFEMATQLHERGYEVALLALLDSRAPGYRTNELDFDGDDAGWLNMIASIYENIYGKSLNVSSEALKVLDPLEQLNYFKERLQMVNLLPPDVGIKQLQGIMQVFKTNFQTACVYMPQAIYPAQVTFFKASEIDAVSHAYSEILDELGLGWDKFSAQPLDIHLVPGDHFTMLSEPHVQVLAKQLTICIERSQADD